MWGEFNCKLDFDNILDQNYNLDEVQAFIYSEIEFQLVYICTKYDTFQKGTIYRYWVWLVNHTCLAHACGDIQLILSLYIV
jgi:hypothetical protein